MSVECHARQLFLIASASVPPGNILPSSGKVTFTDFSAGRSWTQAGCGQHRIIKIRPIDSARLNDARQAGDVVERQRKSLC
jgi:hypothetical protein